MSLDSLILSVFLRYFFLIGAVLVIFNYVYLRRAIVEIMSALGESPAIIRWCWKLMSLLMGVTCSLIFMFQLLVGSLIGKDLYAVLVFILLLGWYCLNIGIMWFHENGLTYAHVMTRGSMNAAVSRVSATIAFLVIATLVFFVA